MKNYEICYKVSHICLVFFTTTTFNLNLTGAPKSVFIPQTFGIFIELIFDRIDLRFGMMVYLCTNQRITQGQVQDQR